MFKKLSIVTFLFILFFIFGIIFLKYQSLPVSDDSNLKDFLVTKGSSVTQIANKLQKEGLIRSSIVFKFYTQTTNSQIKIQAGEFQLSPNLSLGEILNRLKKGPNEIWVTIPEGLRREEIALKFTIALGKDEEFTREFLSLTINKEGYLFPDTYLFPKSITSSQVVDKLTSTFDKKVSDVTFQEIVMASLLERETLSDNEKPIVAGILYKRIENKWPLQVDATLQYAKGNWEPVYAKDKEINSLFNTYKNLGLPPSPIANPGLSSILAAKSPKESDYWYYIHDNKGKIHFAKDLEEHNSNINKYLR